MGQLRFAIAFALAPLLLSALVALAFLGEHASMYWQAFGVALSITAAHSVLIGVPVALLLRRAQRLTFWRTLIAGALIGAVPITLWGIAGDVVHSTGIFGFEVDPELQAADLWPGLLGYPVIAAVFGALGTVGALTWWLAAGAASNFRWSGP